MATTLVTITDPWPLTDPWPPEPTWPIVTFPPSRPRENIWLVYAPSSPWYGPTAPASRFLSPAERAHMAREAASHAKQMRSLTAVPAYVDCIAEEDETTASSSRFEGEDGAEQMNSEPGWLAKLRDFVVEFVVNRVLNAVLAGVDFLLLVTFVVSVGFMVGMLAWVLAEACFRSWIQSHIETKPIVEYVLVPMFRSWQA